MENVDIVHFTSLAHRAERDIRSAERTHHAERDNYIFWHHPAKRGIEPAKVSHHAERDNRLA